MTEAERDPNDLLPLPPAQLHILLALADGEKHGYAVMSEVEQMTEGEVSMGPGTLYGAIKRMLAAGLIEESANRPIAKYDDERRRCYYRLTRLGRSVATEEAERLAALVRVAEAKRLVSSRVPLITGGA